MEHVKKRDLALLFPQHKKNLRLRKDGSAVRDMFSNKKDRLNKCIKEWKTASPCQGVQCILKNKTSRPLEPSERKKKTSSNTFDLKPGDAFLWDKEGNHEKDKMRMLRLWKNKVPYSESLWTVWGIYEITSPREGGCPSRHHKLVMKNTQEAVKYMVFFCDPEFLPHRSHTQIQPAICFHLPHTLCRRSVRPCSGCKQSSLC